MTSIYSITYQPIELDYANGHFETFIRIPVEEVNLIERHGIENDQKAGHNPRRQLNILSLEWLQSFGEHSENILPGQLGEQIILSGIDFNNLEAGDRLQLGKAAIIEITRPRTTCSRLKAVTAVPEIVAKGPAGLLAMVIKSGLIKVGDSVRILETTN